MARFDQNGRVTGVRTGTATITATAHDSAADGTTLSAGIKVTVVASRPSAKVTRVTATVPRTLAVGQIEYITGRSTSEAIESQGSHRMFGGFLDFRWRMRRRGPSPERLASTGQDGPRRASRSASSSRSQSSLTVG